VGDIQTYFYLALISLMMVTLTLIFIGIVFRSLRRASRGPETSNPLILWLIGGAVTVALLFIVFGTAGVLYGFIRYGAS
jgi:multisubunit Na+/H+ antiporter MnhB subunit